MQSVPSGQSAYSAPWPPSSHWPSEMYSLWPGHVASQVQSINGAAGGNALWCWRRMLATPTRSTATRRRRDDGQAGARGICFSSPQFHVFSDDRDGVIQRLFREAPTTEASVGEEQEVCGVLGAWASAPGRAWQFGLLRSPAAFVWA